MLQRLPSYNSNITLALSRWDRPLAVLEALQQGLLAQLTPVAGIKELFLQREVCFRA